MSNFTFRTAPAVLATTSTPHDLERKTNMNDMIPFRITKDDITNIHQLRDATESVAHGLVDRGYAGSLEMFLGTLVGAWWFLYRNTDARTKEVRRYLAARKALGEAAHEFDAARRALKKEV